MKFLEKIKNTKLMKDETALNEAVGIVMSLVMIIIVGSIGVFIADQTETAINLNPNMQNMSDTANMTANANLTAMHDNFLGAGQTGSSFIVILIIAFIGGIAITYLMGMFRSGRKGV